MNKYFLVIIKAEVAVRSYPKHQLGVCINERERSMEVGQARQAILQDEPVLLSLPIT